MQKSVHECQNDLKINVKMEVCKISFNRQRILSKCGKKFGELLPITSPITIEMGSVLTTLVNEGNEKLMPKIEQKCKEIRKEIFDKIGVKVPGFRFRSNENDLKEMDYEIQIYEITSAQGDIQLHEKFYVGKLEELHSLGIIVEDVKDQFMRNKAWIVIRRDWKIVENAGHELLDATDYFLALIKVIIENNLKEFLGHQEVVNLLYDILKEKENSNLNYLDSFLQGVLESPIELSWFVNVLKMLVHEKIPIVSENIESIAIEFTRCRRDDKKLHLIAEDIRSLENIRYQIPGNNSNYFFVKSDRSLEDCFFRAIDRTHFKPILNLKPEIMHQFSYALKENITNQETTAFIVSNAKLRPFVKQLIEIDFPQMPVLSDKELLPKLRSNVRKIVVLLENDEILMEDFNHDELGNENE